ncbi:MAG: TetR/AcrR family transcriptional regulator [Rhodobacter sp.]|nr:TetR/AcrR family transcriptional regulator [Rhodobacter sp.]
MAEPSTDKKRSRGRPRSQKTKDGILAATRELLFASGYQRLTMEGVAARSGASKATVYRWWPTKGALVLDAAADEISIGVVPDCGNTRDELQEAIGQLIETFSKPLASIVIFAAITTAEADPAMAAAFREKYVYPWRVSAAAAIDRGIARGEIASKDPQFVLDVIVGTVFQRTLVMKEPMTDGLEARLLELFLIDAG